MVEPDIISTAEDCFEVQLDAVRDAHRLGDVLREQGVFEAVVPGLRSLAVRFDPRQIDVSDVEAKIRHAVLSLSEPAAAEPVIERTIRVRYGGADGPDFEEVCARTGLSPEALIALHCGQAYPVDMLGFTPGFAYLSGLPDPLRLPRLDTPRVRLPAGSIGIAGGYSGLYAMAGPGGWSVIGRTDDVLFNADVADPFLVKPGMLVWFHPE